MSQDLKHELLKEPVSKEFRSRVMSEAKELLAEQSGNSRRGFFLVWARNFGVAAAAFWLGQQIIPDSEHEENLVLEALEESEDLFLEMDPDDFEILLASENIEELDEVL